MTLAMAMMTTGVAAATLCAGTVWANAARAEDAPAGVGTPDSRREMIAALPAPGPHGSIAGPAALFDRFVGTWDCDYQTFGADGRVTRETGEVRFGWIIGGWALQDIWITYAPGAGAEREIGTAVRFYDARAGHWRVVWIDPAAGRIVMLTGGAVGDRIVLLSQEGDTRRRWSFNDIRPDSFVWRGERSEDGGATWRLQAEYQLRRRSGAAARR